MKQKRNDFDKKPEYWESMTRKSRSVFAFTPVIPRIIMIAIAVGIFFYIISNGYFPDYTTYIYYAVKVIIAYEVLAAAARTLWGPILAVLTGVGLLLAQQMHHINVMSLSDTWQLIILGIVGFLVTIIIKL